MVSVQLNADTRNLIIKYIVSLCILKVESYFDVQMLEHTDDIFVRISLLKLQSKDYYILVLNYIAKTPFKFAG